MPADRVRRRPAACRRRTAISSTVASTGPRPSTPNQADHRGASTSCGSAGRCRRDRCRRVDPDIRVCAVNSMISHPLGRGRRRRRPRARASSTIERPSGVRSARLANRAASRSSSCADPGSGQERRGPSVAEGDGAGLVQQQRGDVAGGLDRSAGQGDHVGPHQPVHAGDADGAQQGADGGRDQTDQQRDQDHRRRPAGTGVGGHRRQRGHRQQEDDRQRGQQDRQGHLVGGLAPRGSLDQGDHLVQERLSGGGGDLHGDLVGQHRGAAGDRGPVAAGLADDRGRLAGDRRLVDAGHAGDHVAVAGDDLPGADQHAVARHAGGCWAPTAIRAVVGRAAGPGSRCGPCAACRPAPCRGPRRPPRRGCRTAPSATARPRPRR